MTSILSAIGSSAVLFAVIKGLFSFLVWYTRDEDPLFRKPIDKLWDELQIRSPFEILQAALRRSTQSSRLNMRNLKGFVQIGVAFVLVNLAALVVASSIWRCHLNNITSTPENRESCGSFLWIWIRYFWDSGSREYLSSCFLLMIFILLTRSSPSTDDDLPCASIG